MKRLIFTLLSALLLGILISACAPTAQQALSPTSAAPTPLPPLPTDVDISSTGPAQCSAVSSGIAPEPPADSPFPEVSDLDWKRGAGDPAVTFVEYGDFQ